MKNKIIIFISLILLCLGVKAEGEANLKNIKVNGVECTCNGYDCSVEVNGNTATVYYELTDSTATVDRLSGFSVDLTSPVTTIKIVVKNTILDEQIENTYNITINKHEASGDYSLKSLKVNDKEISINNEVYVYSYEAKYDEDKIVVTAVPNDSKAKVVGDVEFDFDIERSSGAFDFDVKAENGDVKTYRIVASHGNKPDTTLKTLKVDKGNIIFKKDVYEYEFNVEYAINELIIEAVPTDDNAKVKIEKDTLIVGENKVKITVTNEKAESVYTLLVTREENLDKSLANLKTLTIKEYPKIDFVPNVLDYTLKFSKIPSKLTITAVPESSDGEVEIIGNSELEISKKVIIKVLLKETGITREYSLTIEEETCATNNKIFILISIIILVITIIVLLILQIKEHKRRRKNKIDKMKRIRRKKEMIKEKKMEEEIEII